MMCTPFDIHLAEARRLDRDHKYAKKLNKLDKQHKFVLLRSTYGGNYNAEMRRSLLVDRLFLIYEKLHPKPVARLDTKPLSAPNDKMERCPNCKGKFILLQDKGDPAQLLCFYTTCIRPMSEYACQVFPNGLPEYLSEELETIQRRALRNIFPDLDYQEAPKGCNIATLHQRRQWLTERLFNEIKDNSLHKLHGLLPPRNLITVALRRKRAFNVPLCRTNRLMNSFIMHNAAIF